MYSWILTITGAHSPLKSTCSTIALTVKNGRGTCQFHLRVSQLDLDPSLVASLCRLVVIHSPAPYVVLHGCKSVASHSWNVLSHANFCRVTQITWGGRTQVVSRSLIDRKASQVSRRSVANISRRSSRGRSSGARVYADRLTNGMRGSWACKSAVMQSQVTLITWPVIHLLFTRMSGALGNRFKR